MLFWAKLRTRWFWSERRKWAGLLTRDYGDMPFYIDERLRAGLPMPGAVQIPWTLPLGQAIEGLLLLIGGSFEDEWENRVHYLPLP